MFWRSRMNPEQAWYFNIFHIAYVSVFVLVLAFTVNKAGCQERKVERFAKQRFAKLCNKKWDDPFKCDDHIKRFHATCFDRTYTPKLPRKYSKSTDLFRERRYHICMLLTPQGYYRYLRDFNKGQKSERALYLFKAKYKTTLPKMGWTFRGE